VGEPVLELEPKNAADYVLLQKMYAAASNRHFRENVEQQQKERGMKK
jgi:hypothetical protein